MAYKGLHNPWGPDKEPKMSYGERLGARFALFFAFALGFALGAAIF